MKELVSLSQIKIPHKFRQSVPKKSKLLRCEKYFKERGKLDSPIVINTDYSLIDGYIRYLVLKNNNIKETIASVVTTDYKNMMTTYVYAKHDPEGREFVWRLPQCCQWKEFVVELLL